MQTGLTSHHDGNVEAACGMAKRHLTTSVCDATIKNEMAIAILNSDVDFDRLSDNIYVKKCTFTKVLHRLICKM